MSWSSTEAEPTSSSKLRRKAAAMIATVAAAAAGLSVASGSTAFASAGTVAASTPVVTRAALDPSLVSGRGADVGFDEQEAENAPTNGTIIGPSTAAYTLAADASARSPPRLTPAHHTDFPLPPPPPAITPPSLIP